MGVLIHARVRASHHARGVPSINSISVDTAAKRRVIHMGVVSTLMMTGIYRLDDDITKGRDYFFPVFTAHHSRLLE